MKTIDVVLAGMKVIDTVTRLVRDATSGKVTPEVALAKLKMMESQLDANNAAADAKLQVKFSKKGS